MSSSSTSRKLPHGLLLINKPIGLTSHDVVAKVRRILATREVGHSGTLDPLASGLMVLLIGEATKLSQYITEGDKAYQVGLRLGITTDTLDITGQVQSEKAVMVSDQEVEQMALSLQGEMELPIPLFSAKKVDGKKLYEYAREGHEIDLPKKTMKFWDVKTVAATQKGCPEFSLQCSKGSFIRSWVSLLGEKLGCGATMTSLIRTKSHCYTLSQAISIEELESLDPEKRDAGLIALDQAIPTAKKIRIRGQDESFMRNGQISHNLRSQLITLCNPEVDQVIQVLPENRDGQLLALIGLEKGQGFKIKRVFKY